jgi:dihydrofolate reductase
MIRTFIVAAMTADGFIARDNSVPSTAWTSKVDKKRFSELSKRAGVVIMGSVTYETIGKPLPGRVNIVYVLGDKKYEGAETTTKSPAELIADLEKRGFKEVAICGGSTIYTMFMKSGLVDTLYLTMEPVIFGSGTRLFKEPIDAKLELVSSEKVENSTLLEYKVLK